MAKNNNTIFQNLSSFFRGGEKRVNNYNILPDNDIIFKTNNKEEYEKQLLQAKQQKLLSYQWKRAGYDTSQNSMANATGLKLMMRDADLMDGFPEIGASLDILSEETTTINSKGKMLNIYSKSERIKSVLEDLFVNRLDIHVFLPMIARGTCKYGNNYQLLNISKDNGIIGWRQLPVYEIERIENGLQNPYVASINTANLNELNPEDTNFIWVGHNESLSFPFWQIAHFRLLTDSTFLPYGTSWLHKARRHWRMLSLMEDMMLVYRLERSVERRVFKIFVGGIDDEDVPAYVNEIANNMKRTSIVDPETGQLDLRKNFMPVWKNTPIPLLDGRTITIENLSKEYENGKVNYVYSIQDKTHKIVPGKVVWCGKNYTAKKMVKITLDDDTFMAMAPEHEVIMRDGSKKRADMLMIGESIMPFYRVINKKPGKKYKDRYEQIYNPNTGTYEYTHRLIAENIKKEDKAYNTVRHVNFNRYDNTPENLKWMDYHEHKKFHQKLIGENWKSEKMRKKMIDSMREYHATHEFSQERKNFLSQRQKEKYKNGFPKNIAEKISVALKNKYQNDEIFKKEMDERRSKRDKSYLKKSEFKEKMRKISIERESYKCFGDYNSSDLHKQHNALRSSAMFAHWKSNKREDTIKNMTIYFDEFIWEKIRESILSGIIYNRNSMLNYINTFLIEHLLEINTNKRLHNKKCISRTILESRVQEKGFKTITECIDSFKKNHKIKNIEWIEGDDVYCMSVVGLNGEDDRHNFALRTIHNNNNTWDENGCFVSNSMDSDYFIPVRSENAPNPIETLSGAQNLTAMDDINYMENKVLSALRIPKTFLNFQDAQGKGQNLSIMDIRFTRTVNRVQQALLMELNKIAIIHLYLLGFTDDLTNFTLSMNNPSAQSELLEIENLSKRIGAAAQAVADPGNGIPIYSWHRALKEIVGMSDAEIAENLNEIRLEKALASELEKTSQIIKRSGIFDPVDRIYGEIDAEYTEGEEGGMPGEGGGSAPVGGFGGDFGDDMLGDLGEPGAEDMGDIGGEAGTVDMGEAANVDSGEPTPAMEGKISNKAKNLITEVISKKKAQEERIRKYNSYYEESAKKNPFFENYMKEVIGVGKESVFERTEITDKTFIINEEMNGIIKNLNDMVSKEKSE